MSRMESLKAVLKAEMKLVHLKLNHHDDHDFFCSQWRIPHVAYVVARVFLSGYTLFAWIDLLVLEWNNAPFAFFTTWSYTVLTFHFLVSAILSIVFFKKATDPLENQWAQIQSTQTNGVSNNTETSVHSNGNGGTNNSDANTTFDTQDTPPSTKQQSSGPNNMDVSASSTHSMYESFRQASAHTVGHTAWYFKVSWILANIIYIAAPIVTLIYLITLYPRLYPNGGPLNLQDTNIHALNLVFVFVDHAISARPIRLLHAVYPMIYGVSYIIFSVIYWAVDHSHVLYPNVLDWNHPGTSIGVTIGLTGLVVPTLQLMHFGLYQLKVYICRNHSIGRLRSETF